MRSGRYKPVHVPRGAVRCPLGLAQYLGAKAHESLEALGNLDVLRTRKLALFCSVRCPGDLILKTYDVARALRGAGLTVVGGFQSPIEKDCLELLLRGAQPIIVCPARSLDGMRIPSAWRNPLAESRLLLLSPFQKAARRPTVELTRLRNELVAALADQVLIAYAELGGKTEAIARMVLGWGKPVLTLDSPENAGLVALGAKPIKPDQVDGLLK